MYINSLVPKTRFEASIIDNKYEKNIGVFLFRRSNIDGNYFSCKEKLQILRRMDFFKLNFILFWFMNMGMATHFRVV